LPFASGKPLRAEIAPCAWHHFFASLVVYARTTD